MSKITKGNKTKTKLQKEFCALVLSLQWRKHQLSKFEITNFSEKAKSVEASKPNQRLISLPHIREDFEDFQ